MQEPNLYFTQCHKNIDSHPATWTEAMCLVLLSFGAETPTLAPSLTVRQEKSCGNRLTAGS